ncbi:hypothetical protein GS399_19660 [Pedobacter sp. HMF7647]|uniref:Uncharacterized protein n=1 Tax=Hufsiella arboris TaxID=2695275 RepID=A0A7K1YGL6_9SPHI|nr:GyrI-like domain-containing protein [Hufsiella arboris]MXV53189.1 hypothetical protein [Hufsiella arboris]
MKKAILFLSIIILLAFSLVYLVIPSRIDVSETLETSLPETLIARLLTEKTGWQTWLPSITRGAKDNSYHFKKNELDFTFSENTETAANVQVSQTGFTANGKIDYIVKGAHRTTVRWYEMIKASKNPITRIRQFIFAMQTRRQMKHLLDSLNNLTQHSTKVYGYNIRITKVKDSVLIGTRAIFSSYPSAEKVDALVRKLKDQAKMKNALITDSPMLNITQTGQKEFTTMVALPVNKFIQPSGEVYIRRMVMGNLLETQVKGGPNSINKAMAQLTLFKEDYKMISPAVPYQSMITNRLAEKDSSKWVTKIYYPVF